MRASVTNASYPDYALPPLPPIRSQALAREVFMHSGMIGGRRSPVSLAAASIPIADRLGGAGDNQKLEHVGDGLIGTVVTLLLHDMYPGLRHGPATTLKARLVSNETLAHLSRRYGLPARLIALRHERPVLLESEKTCADVFEAYVAGVFYDRRYPPPLPQVKQDPQVKEEAGADSEPLATAALASGPPAMSKGGALDALAAWLDPLFAPLAQHALEQMTAEQDRMAQSASPAGAPPGAASPAQTDAAVSGAMAKLNQHFSFKESGLPIYHYFPVDGAWRCDVTATKLDGVVLRATAVRASKKHAATHAAYDVCLQAGI